MAPKASRERSRSARPIQAGYILLSTRVLSRQNDAPDDLGDVVESALVAIREGRAAEWSYPGDHGRYYHMTQITTWPGMRYVYVIEWET